MSVILVVVIKDTVVEDAIECANSNDAELCFKIVCQQYAWQYTEDDIDNGYYMRDHSNDSVCITSTDKFDPKMY